jgi:hypothetical protein
VLSVEPVALGSEVLKAVVMKDYVFWEITPRIALKVKRRSGGICRLHVHGQGISQARERHDAGSKQGSPQGQLTLNKLQVVISPRRELFMNYSSLQSLALRFAVAHGTPAGNYCLRNITLNITVFWELAFYSLVSSTMKRETVGSSETCVSINQTTRRPIVITVRTSNIRMTMNLS